jgi:hypothetical protein
MHKVTNVTRVALLVFLPLMAGCKLENAYERWASQASDSVDVVQGESALLMAATENVDPAMSGDEAALAAADGATRFWQPSGCLTTTVEESTVTYVLVDCTGPYGLVHVTGTVVVTYTPQGDGLGYVSTADGLDINGAIVDIDGQGVYHRTGTRHEITGSINGSGVGPRGHEFSRHGNRTVSWDTMSECLTLEGVWMTDVEGYRWTTTVDGFEKCREACPAAGGGISWEGERGTLSVSFDGSDEAAWETANGRSGTVDLFCEG